MQILRNYSSNLNVLTTPAHSAIFFRLFLALFYFFFVAFCSGKSSEIQLFSSPFFSGFLLLLSFGQPIQKSLPVICQRTRPLRPSRRFSFAFFAEPRIFLLLTLFLTTSDSEIAEIKRYRQSQRTHRHAENAKKPQVSFLQALSFHTFSYISQKPFAAQSWVCRHPVQKSAGATLVQVRGTSGRFLPHRAVPLAGTNSRSVSTPSSRSSFTFVATPPA